MNRMISIKSFYAIDDQAPMMRRCIAHGLARGVVS